jgi:hypothetical protein
MIENEPKTISDMDWKRLWDCIQTLRDVSQEIGGSFGERCDIDWRVGKQILLNVQAGKSK